MMPRQYITRGLGGGKVATVTSVRAQSLGPSMEALDVLATAAVLALASPAIARADDTTALISGRFVMADGSGIAGATITIGSAGQFQATKTDRDGYFIIFRCNG
jgi:hypothetical protein